MADTTLDMSAVREQLAKKAVGPVVQREPVGQVQARLGLPKRRDRQIVGAERKWIRWQSQHAPAMALRTRLHDIAHERRRFGHRPRFILLQREGEPSGISRIFRVHCNEGLTVRKRRAKRKVIGTRAAIVVQARTRARRSLDFVQGQIGCGWRFHIPMDMHRFRSGQVPFNSASFQKPLGISNRQLTVCGAGSKDR